MKTPNNKPEVVSQETKNEKVAQAWIEWVNGGRDTRALGEMTSAILRRSVASRVKGHSASIRGEMQEEIRQEAAVLLFDRYLSGNAELTRATAEGNEAEIAEQIERSSYAAAGYALQRHAKRAAYEAKKSELIAQALAQGDSAIDAGHGAFALPPEAKHKLAMLALKIAVREGRLTKENATMTGSILNGDTTQTQIADRCRVSRSAISQRIKHVTSVLGGIIENVEVQP